ncbi:MAG: efflux transporter outer membrane subunit [Pseudomonadota bacterium]
MRKSLIALALLSLTGCANVPELRMPKFDLPAAWKQAQAPAATEAARPLASDWWKAYGDARLDALVDEALTHNADLRLAAARIEEARASLGLARASQAVQAQATADVNRERRTQVGAMPASGNPANNTYQVQVQAAYELDLWGRYREASNAARAQLLASEYGREVVRISLAGGVAQGYFALRALDAQLALVAQTRENRLAAVELQKQRLNAGVSSELELRQAEAELAALDASRAQLTQAVQQQELALAVLVGRNPRGLMEDGIARGSALQALGEPPAIPVGLPSDLLARRPDLRQAEQNLLATHARIKEAKAALYPDLTLTAYLGSESKALSDLFSGPAAIWGLGAGLVQTLLNGNRTEEELKARDARQTQALIAYEQAVRQAFREVLDALVAHRQARELAEAEGRRAEALHGALELADLRYRNGLTNYLTVLDAQRNALQAELNRIEARRAQLSASADLAKALGGGWQATTATP